MLTPLRFTWNSSLRFLFAVFICALLSGGALTATPLDDYVQAKDPATTYGEGPVKKIEKGDHTFSVYKLTSQNWLDKDKVERTEWWHWVTVVDPKERKYNKAMVFIGGGSNRGDNPPTDAGPLAQVAQMTGSMVIEVKQIPNQPLKFVGDTDERYLEKGRGEDELIAFAWDKFLKTQDPHWLPRLPMTKAVVLAMDLVQKEYPDIEGFFVAGGSKRGWTTWTVAAVDERVVGISPAVIDVLNVAKSLDNHYASYGFWAPAIGDYADMDILSRIHTPEFEALEDVVDPYSYLDRLTMPKCLFNSAGDQFFPPDSWKFYFNDLKGENYLRYMANTDHGLSPQAYMDMASFYHALIADTPRPKFSWELAEDGQFKVNCETEPTQVLLWQATNPEARDFRLESLGPKWVSEPLEAGQDGAYSTSIEKPEKGFTAFFVELEFPNPDFMFPFKFTTGINILPDIHPHAGEWKGTGQE